MNISKIWIYYNVIFFVAIGIFTLVKPYSIAEAKGYHLSNSTAIAELKAAYGGLLIVLGLGILIASLRLSIGVSLAFIGLLYLGYASGRLTGILLNHALDRTTIIFFSVELVSLVITALLYYLAAIKHN